ncbi:MAG: DUF2203 family protein [Acidobacteriia bacterium]|nr:DUF2203 family protein [Terriglobia bacterium]MYG00938.1 DUF2203 family protein [Terriglobia bacterium]MYK12255.1 DUF2203 family protein [Terriglobia bacterium]
MVRTLRCEYPGRISLLRGRSDMSRYFTLQEAESLIPTVQEGLKAAISAKERIGEIDQAMQNLSAHICMVGGAEINPDKVARQKLERISLMQLIDDRVSDIQSSGCLVKDLDLGLLDFPALLNGVEVYLCWKLGESRIEWWHSTQEGYSGRRRIMDEFDDSSTPLPN